ncbi:unnamed protein product [Adineta ricciae]|uniref:Uncharacterized protein n=1 Tax=Adineta ricciae TaxID=249248 RepID=A0A815SMP8_ADIRI|nr:unnamed protein product [Adineta ricciae]CAF1494730.1 unnamed protein product [Adineta ricciae]
MDFLKEFFDFKPPKDNKICGICKSCGKTYVDKFGSTGNFHKHLKRAHDDEYKKAKFPNYTKPTEDTGDVAENSTNNNDKINQTILEELIVKCNLPLSIAESRGFRNFMRILAPKWKNTSSRYYTKVLIPSLMKNIEDKIKNLLHDVKHLTITIDLWTDRRGRSFVGVTGHFLDSRSVPQALLLDFLRFKGAHTAENIHNITEQILDKLEIKDKVFRIVTDNAANMIKAYKFGLNVVENHGHVLQDDSDQQQDDSSFDFITDDLMTSNEWTLIDWCDSGKDSVDIDTDCPIRVSCFAHSLQLSIRDGLKNSPFLSKSLAKCIKLARRSHKSTKVAELLEDVGKTIKRSNMTRWSSEYSLIKSIIALGKKTIDEITDVIDSSDFKFNSNDFIVLQEAIDILEPFAEITSRVQSESIVTASLVVPSIVHIIDHLKNIKPNIQFLKKMCTQLETSVHTRFAGITKRLTQQIVSTDDPFSDPLYFVSAVLDPEFKFYWLGQMDYKPAVETQMKQLLIQLILNECDTNDNISFDDTQGSQLSPSKYISNSYTTQAVDTSIIKKRKLFQYDDHHGLSPESKVNPLSEINAYINDPVRSKFSSYWNRSQLHSLKVVVERIFSVQASSAPIERVFSQAGIVMSPRRTSMQEEVFRSLVFLRVNQDFI